MKQNYEQRRNSLSYRIFSFIQKAIKNLCFWNKITWQYICQVVPIYLCDCPDFNKFVPAFCWTNQKYEAGISHVRYPLLLDGKIMKIFYELNTSKPLIF